MDQSHTVFVDFWRLFPSHTGTLDPFLTSIPHFLLPSLNLFLTTSKSIPLPLGLGMGPIKIPPTHSSHVIRGVLKGIGGVDGMQPQILKSNSLNKGHGVRIQGAILWQPR